MTQFWMNFSKDVSLSCFVELQQHKFSRWFIARSITSSCNQRSFTFAKSVSQSSTIRSSFSLFCFFLPFVKPLYSSTVQHRLPFLVSALLHCFIVSSALYIIITRWYPFARRISVLTHSLKIFGIVVTWQNVLWRSEENLFYRCTLFLHVSPLPIIFFSIMHFLKNLNLQKCMATWFPTVIVLFQSFFTS